MDQQKYCGTAAWHAALRVQLRLAPGNCHVRTRILSVEPVVLSENVGARNCLQEKEPGQLVSEVRDGTGERAGGEWRILLATRRYAGRSAGNVAVVSENHG